MQTVESLQIKSRVESELATYVYEEPDRGTAVGVPWSAAQVTKCIEQRQVGLVTPYRSLLRVLESDCTNISPNFSNDVWIIWEEGDYLVFFDPVNEFYGLAAWQSEEDVPTYWGVYGDLIYVLCAI